MARPAQYVCTAQYVQRVVPVVPMILSSDTEQIVLLAMHAGRAFSSGAGPCHRASVDGAVRVTPGWRQPGALGIEGLPPATP